MIATTLQILHVSHSTLTGFNPNLGFLSPFLRFCIQEERDADVSDGALKSPPASLHSKKATRDNLTGITWLVARMKGTTLQTSGWDKAGTKCLYRLP